MTHSVRLTFRLGQKGDQHIEAITQQGCAIHVDLETGDDGVVVVNLSASWVDPAAREGEADKAAPYPGGKIVGVNDRHVIRVGHGHYGPARVISHDVSPYDWRLVNFAATSQANLIPSLNGNAAGVQPAFERGAA